MTTDQIDASTENQPGRTIHTGDNVQGHKVGGDQFVLSGDLRGATVNIKSTIQAEASMARIPMERYKPPPLPEPGEMPEPGALPPGSRLLLMRNELFTGRTDALLGLAQALLYEARPTALVTQTIAGMGGVGKTQLAIEYTYRYGRYFEGVHWLSAAEPAGLAAEVAACGAAMRLPDWPDTQPDQVEYTRYVWAGGGPRLVILDNLEEPDAAREWLGWLSGCGARVLVTARRADWPPDLGLTPLWLHTFSEAESRAFLRRYLPEARATTSEVSALAERVGHLPLAEELAGRYLRRHRRLSVGAYVERLERVLQDPAMTGWRAEEGNPSEHDLDLAATFTVSWERISDEVSRTLFKAAGYCAPNQPIPCDLLQRTAGLDEATCDEALDQLIVLGLLRPGEQDEYVIHPLLGEFARQRDAAGEVLDALSFALVALADEALDGGQFEHVLVLTVHAHTAAKAADRAGKPVLAGGLLNRVGMYVWEAAALSAAKNIVEHVLELDRGTFGSDDPNVGSAYNALGTVLGELGDFEGACTALARALAIWERAYGPAHPDVALALNKLGLMLHVLGDLQGAQERYERALAIWEQAYGPDHLNVARAQNNLGGVLDAVGDLQGARERYERALAILEQAYGPDHPNVAMVLNSLAGVLRQLGDLRGARERFERALAIWEQAYGPDHPDVALAQNSLGLVLHGLGDFQGARERYERALAIWEQAYGPEHPNVALAQDNLGEVLGAMGDLRGARERYKRALAIWEQAYGPEHPNVARAQNNLGEVLRQLGDSPGMRERFERALMILEQAYGPEHPNVATELNSLRLALDALGHFQEARGRFERALAILEQAYGPERDAADEYHHLGRVAQERSGLDAAEGWYQSALAIFEHPGLERYAAYEYHQLGMVAQKRADFDAAESWYQRALVIYERLGHPPLRVDTLTQLGILRWRQARSTEAVSWFGRALTIAAQYKMRTGGQILEDLARLLKEMGEDVFVAVWAEALPEEALPEEALHQALARLEE